MSKMTSEKENIAAITATFHQDKRWRTFYEANRDALSGFPGIWVYCVDAGMTFTTAEKRLGIEWDGEWIDAIETFSDALFVAAKPLTIKELEATAKTCIQAMIAKNAAPAPVKADKDFFVLQMEDPDDLEDHHFLNCYAPDDSWLTMDRRNMWEDALTFKTEAEARAKFAEVGGGKKERITLIYIDADKDIHEVAVLHDTLTPNPGSGRKY